jgi:hypothetical protein
VAVMMRVLSVEVNVGAEKKRGGFYSHESHEGHGHHDHHELAVYGTGEQKSEFLLDKKGSYSDFQGSVTQQREKINTLQDVYEDWKHPAFNGADFYKRVFTEGLKSHGEAASIQYWKSKREPYRQVFEKKIEQVEKELGSPLLSYMSDAARVLARKAAFENPDKTLKFLSHLQEIKKTEQHALLAAKQAQAKALQEKALAIKLEEEKEQARQEGFKKASSHYFRFRDLTRELEKRDDFDLEKERHALGKSLYKNREFFEHLEKMDPEISKLIKQVSQENHLQKVREMDRGGFSL